MTRPGDAHRDLHFHVVELARPQIRRALCSWYRRGRRVETAVIFVVVIEGVITVAAATGLGALYMADFNEDVLGVLANLKPGHITIISMIGAGLWLWRARLVHRPR